MVASIPDPRPRPLTEARSTAQNTSYTGPFLTVTSLYFIFGFITTLNMALVPHLRHIFGLSYGMAMLAESAFFLAFLLFSAPTGWLIESIGYKRTMVVALLLQVAGALLFVPAARMVSFPLFLAASFLVGAGVAALQTSANPYVAILGPEHSAAVRLTLAQAINAIGCLLGPILAGTCILTDSSGMSPRQIADTVRTPYLAISGGLLVLALAVAFLHLPAIQPPTAAAAALGTTQRRSIWGCRHTILGSIGIFLYVGV